MNVPVKTINGEDQFNIICEFGKKHSALKCLHAKFTEAKGDFVEGDLSYLPLIKEYLHTPISITWENGESVSVNYKIYRERASKIISNDYNIHCSVSVNDVNTLVVHSFDTEDEKKTYEETISNCIDLFDSNNYPIQFIFPKNGGGYSIYSQWIEKILSPHDDVNYIVSLRESDYTNYMLKKGFAVNLYDSQTCQERRSKRISKIPILNSIPLGYWYAKPNINKYGDVEHKVTQTSIEVFPKKKLMKKP
ncbi:hypothetical protein ENUP19_0198G0006 [Entamoeba nuttalli]|uniref:Uncharacterized protein n=1 Tax=Entamoeba nuttalli TaxID=412467 RepID=A0ABQ0DNR9_9EUKA